STCNPGYGSLLPSRHLLRRRNWHASAQPWQKLPISSRPAVLAPGVSMVAGREVVEDFDIRRESAAREVRFNQVVGEDVILRKRSPGSSLESIHVVNALTGECRAAEEVLVNIGNGA